MNDKNYGIDELLGDKRDAVLQLAKKYRASNVRVFGSVARGEANEASDVDFLVDFPADYSLLDRIALKQELEDLLERKVDVVLAKRLREMIRDEVLRDAIAL